MGGDAGEAFKVLGIVEGGSRTRRETPKLSLACTPLRVCPHSAFSRTLNLTVTLGA